MSEPIQSIAQNNYILHNIDAKKLYVQEPLFTANSGDAVYVGWRPDETVLWEGSYTPVNNGYIDLSGSLSAYEKVKFTVFGFSSFMPQNYEYDFYSGGDKTIPIIAFGIPSDGGVRINTCKATCNDEFNKLTFTICKQENVIGTTVSTAAFNSVISKVIGINRKENA